MSQSLALISSSQSQEFASRPSTSSGTSSSQALTRRLSETSSEASLARVEHMASLHTQLVRRRV